MGKASWLYFDIETYRTRVARVVEEITGEALAKRPAQNAAKELKAAWDTAEARIQRTREAVAKTAVDVTLAEPLSVAFAVDDGDVQARQIGFDPDAEANQLALLSEEWSDCADANTVWGGHNIEGFDLAVLLTRMRRHKVRPPAAFPTYRNRRWHGRTYDTMKRAPTSNGLDFIAVDVLCDRYGVVFPTHTWNGQVVDGSMVGRMFEAKAWDDILEYNRQDVRGERMLVQAMTFGGEWGGFERADVYDQVAELRASELPEGARAIAIVKLLESAGMI